MAGQDTIPWTHGEPLFGDYLEQMGYQYEFEKQFRQEQEAGNSDTLTAISP